MSFRFLFTERARILLSHHYRSETSGGRWNCWALFSDSFLFQLFVFQDDHKLSLDELHRKYGTDLNRVGKHCIPSFFALKRNSHSSEHFTKRDLGGLILVWWFFSFCVKSPLLQLSFSGFGRTVEFTNTSLYPPTEQLDCNTLATLLLTKSLLSASESFRVKLILGVIFFRRRM